MLKENSPDLNWSGLFVVATTEEELLNGQRHGSGMRSSSTRAGDGDGAGTGSGAAIDGNGHGRRSVTGDGCGAEAESDPGAFTGSREADGGVEAAGNGRSNFNRARVPAGDGQRRG